MADQHNSNSGEEPPVLLDPTSHLQETPRSSTEAPSLESSDFFRILIVAPTTDRKEFDQYLRLGLKIESISTNVSVSVASQRVFNSIVLQHELSHIPLPSCQFLPILTRIYNPIFPVSQVASQSLGSLSRSIVGFLNPTFQKWNLVIVTPLSYPLALPGILHFKIPFIFTSTYPLRPSQLGYPMFGSPSPFLFVNASKFKIFEASQNSLLKPILSPLFISLKDSPDILDQGLYSFLFNLNIPIFNLFSQYLLPKPSHWPKTDISLGYLFYGSELFHDTHTITFSENSEPTIIDQLSKWIQKAHNVVVFHLSEYFDFIEISPNVNTLDFLSQLVDIIEKFNFRAIIYTGSYVLPPESVFKSVLKRATIDLSSRIKYISGHGITFPSLSWVLPQCRAVVLIPEPFSVNEAISAGLPILGLYYNKKSSFWASSVVRCNFGPQSINMAHYSTDDICDSLRSLLGPDMKKWKFYSSHAGKYILSTLKQVQTKNVRKILQLMQSHWTWDSDPSSATSPTIQLKPSIPQVDDTLPQVDGTEKPNLVGSLSQFETSPKSPE